MTDVTAILVAFRSGAGLGDAVASVLRSQEVDVRVILVNNDPADPEPRTLAEADGRVVVIESGGNVGFCAAVNRALAEVSSSYAAFINPDAILEPDYLARLVARLAANPDLASAGGRILRRGANRVYVDSTGLAFVAGRRAVDIGHGMQDDGRRSGVEEVFGVTAAAAVYRTSSLRAVAVHGQILPESFFMYLDDVDLSWRLRAAGYSALVDHAAIAWHERGAAKGVEDPASGLRYLRQMLARHTARPDYVRVLSLANHVLMLVRNDDPDAFLAQLPAYLARRVPLEAFTALQRPLVAMAARRRVARLLPGALIDREEIRRMRRVASRDLRRWLR